MNKNKLLSLFSALLILALIVTVNNAKIEKYSIGLNIDLNESSNPYADQKVNAIQMAVNHFNVSGGYNGTYIDVIIKDNEGNAEKAEQIQESFAKSRDIIGVISSASDVNVRDSISLTSNRSKVPNIMLDIEASNLKETSDQRNNFNYRIAMSTKFQGYLLSNYASKNLKVKSVLVIDTSSDDTQTSFQDQFIERFEHLKGKVHFAASNNINDIVEELTINSVNAIVIADNAINFEQLIRDIRDHGVNIPILTAAGSVVYDKSTLENLNFDNIHLLDHFISGEIENQLSDDYFDEYKVPINKYSALAYDSANLLLNALVVSNDSDKLSVKNQLDITYHLTLTTGRISVDIYNNAFKSAYIRIFKDKKELNAVSIFPE